MDLHTGCLRHSHSWKHLPITANIITGVEKLAHDQDQLRMNNGSIFECEPNLPMENAPLEDDFPFEDDDDSVATIKADNG